MTLPLIMLGNCCPATVRMPVFITYVYESRLLLHPCCGMAWFPHAGAQWPSRSSTATGQPVVPHSAILQDLCSGVLPWELQQSDATLPLIEQRMALNALKIRAAGTEQQLVRFELDSLMHSYRSRLQAVDTAVRDNAAQQHAIAADVQFWVQQAGMQDATAQPQQGGSQDAAAQPEQQQPQALGDALRQQLLLSGQQQLLLLHREQLLVVLDQAFAVANHIVESGSQGPLGQQLPVELAQAVADGLHFSDAEGSEADADSVCSWDEEDYCTDQDAGAAAAVAPGTVDGDVDMTDAANRQAPQVRRHQAMLVLRHNSDAPHIPLLGCHLLMHHRQVTKIVHGSLRELLLRHAALTSIFTGN